MTGGDGAPSESEEDDYMSMVIAEPNSKPESSIQKRKRKEREGEERGRVKSKKEQDAEAATKREEALAAALPETSKGFKMMAKFGFKPGQKLGATENPHAISEPIGVDLKDDRGGIGMDSEKKRKVREAMEGEAKRVKAEEGDFRDRVAREREEKRIEGQLYGAMKVAEKLDTGTEGEAVETRTSAEAPTAASRDAETKDPTQPAVQMSNVLWRTLVRERAEKERERRMRYDLQQSLTRNANYDDPEEDKYDRQALGKEEIDLEEEDPELEAFTALPAFERLEKVVMHLRDSHNYCFWCKYQYPDKEMEGCPGTTEEDHD